MENKYLLFAAILQIVIGAVSLVLSVVFCFTDTDDLVKWIINAVFGTGFVVIGAVNIWIMKKSSPKGKTPVD